MSEVSRGGGAFAKVVQKTLVRTKTKVLQRVGKAEKTTDEVFKDNITYFQKQQATALRLQKEMKHYITCVKAMSLAARSLCSVLKDTYEEDWYDPHSVHTSLNSLDLMHTDYEAELSERVYPDLSSYIDQFPVYKEKMNKRNRKRLDYDNARRAYESLYGAKKPDHTKISKAHESLEEAKGMFEEINGDLHRELPRFYENRVELVANNLIKLFTAEANFHTNTGKLNDKLTELLQTLITMHTQEMQRLRESPYKKADVSHNGGGDAESNALDLSSLSTDARSPMKSNGHSGDMATPKSVSKPAQQSGSSQRFSSTEETEVRKAPPPARPVAGPQSPVTSLPLAPIAPIAAPNAESNPFLSDDEATPHSEPSENEKAESQISSSTPKSFNPAENPTETLSDPNLEAAQTSVEAESSGNPFEEGEDEPGAIEGDGSRVEVVPDPDVKDEVNADVPKGEVGVEGDVGSETTDTPAPISIEPVVILSDHQGRSSTRHSTPRSESKPSTSSSTYINAPSASLSDYSVLYQVMATHPYEAEDGDELSFDAGEIIDVVQFDNEEEQDDGWLMGVNTNTQAKGVFPANFTQKIARKT